MSQHADMSDEALLGAWRGADRLAGAELFSRYHESIANFFMRRLESGTDDLVQDTFLGLLEGLDRFRGEASVRTLLFAIARNKLHKFLRNLVRDKQRFDPREQSIAALGTSPTQRLVASDDDRLLLFALRELPLDTQMMLELHYWENMRLREIAAVLELPAGTIKSRMHRARRQLEDNMERLAESPEQLNSTRDSLSKWARRLQTELDAAERR